MKKKLKKKNPLAKLLKSPLFRQKKLPNKRKYSREQVRQQMLSHSQDL